MWRIIMRNLKILQLKYLVFALLLFTTTRYVYAGPPPESDVTLVVLVTWGDVDNTPAKGVYVEAHAYLPKLKSEKSFVLTMVRPGRYEVSLPPGVYDVFVSDSSSEPRCRRMRVAVGDANTWLLKLDLDEVYIQH
jgi:hypothetical protein